MSLARKTTFGMVTILAALVVTAPVASAKGRPLNTEMIGANEVPNPGDPDGSGTVHLRLNQGRHRICFVIEVTDITLPATAAHIHPGAVGEFNPPIVTLGTPDATGLAEGCVTDVAKSVIKDIRQHPADYYVNVHTTDYLDGAIRGQLAKGH